MSDERILVTGCCGFIGSHVAQNLISKGAYVVGVDNFDPFYDRSLKERNLNEIQSSDPVGLFKNHEIDICDQSGISEIIKEHQISGIIHLAAKAGVRPSIADARGYANTNIVGTQSVLSAASEQGCKRVICASSSSVYGNNTKVPFAELDLVNDPISPYAATKRASEILGFTHHHLTGLPIAMLRFFTVFGPRQRPDLAMSIFLSKIASGQSIKRFGDGSTSRDYTYIDDIVDGILRAYQQIDVHGYRIWNLGGDHPITLNELIETVSKVVDTSPVIEELEMQPGDVDRTWADLQRANNELNYNPSTSIIDGLAQQWEWMKKIHQI